jgi:protein involved in polysaccharide export with SLBB domain
VGKILKEKGMKKIILLALFQMVFFSNIANADEKTNTTPALLTMDTLNDVTRLVAGDRLSFRIVEEEDEEAKEVVVGDVGEIEIPQLGRMLAKDKTCRQLAVEIKKELEKRTFFQATVILGINSLNKNRGRIYLSGAVRLQGPQEIPGDEIFTVSKAILRAGGFTDWANQKSVRITRQKKAPDTGAETKWVNVQGIFKYGNVDNDVILEAGDLVHVTEKTFRF